MQDRLFLSKNGGLIVQVDEKDNCEFQLDIKEKLGARLNFNF
jgi:hypothetical protein